MTKGTSRAEATSNRKKIKSIALPIVKLCKSEGAVVVSSLLTNSNQTAAQVQCGNHETLSNYNNYSYKCVHVLLCQVSHSSFSPWNAFCIQWSSVV